MSPFSTSRLVRSVLAPLLLVLALVGAAGFLGRSIRAGSDADTAADARHAYNEKTSEKYNFRYGKDHPFLPSNITTDTGEFINPKDFPTAQYCGHCHQESHQEWRESAHSNSNRAPWYLRNVALLNDSKGVEFSRHCEGCHDPIATVAGVLTQSGPQAGSRKRPYDQDGITCTVCHSIQKIDLRGTGSYVLGVPAVLVDETGAPIRRQVSDAEILAHLDRHSAAVMKPFYRTSEFCSTCHKAALPHELNDYKWQRAMTPYDEWQNSSFAKQSPLPFYRKDVVSTCETCHMQREQLVGRDPGAKAGKLASHRWLGANTLVPEVYHYPDQESRVTAFLQNNVFNVDIFGLEREPAGSKEREPAGSKDREAAGNKDREPASTPQAQPAVLVKPLHPDEQAQRMPVSATATSMERPADAQSHLIAPLGLVPFTAAAGDHLTVSVVIQNKGAAHSHVPEQRDMYESWVDFTVRDSAGKVLAESGALSANGDLDPAAHSFTNRLINKQGTLNDLHQVWTNRVLAYNNSIQSGRSQLVRYGFTVPANAREHISVTATVRYRRFDQHFVDFGMGKHYVQPIVDMVAQTRTIQLGKNDPVTPDKVEIPTWMRWNNYGIALLDAQQYAASVDAFHKVATLRPDYADAYTNIAIVLIQWEKYAEAMPPLEHALTLLPEDPRALYYRALVERNQGNVDEAIADLRKVEAAYPRSRDARRELGFSFFQLHRYEESRAEYEALQSIDPDDLAAHYNLSILYRRLGRKDEAQQQARYFADQKDDPTASTYALEYLRKHQEVAQESVVWHVHDLDSHGVAAPTGVTADMIPSQQMP